MIEYVDRFLFYLNAERALAPLTIESYTRDLRDFAALARKEPAPWATLRV